jgi:hypothetical protein
MHQAEAMARFRLMRTRSSTLIQPYANQKNPQP